MKLEIVKRVFFPARFIVAGKNCSSVLDDAQMLRLLGFMYGYIVLNYEFDSMGVLEIKDKARAKRGREETE